MRRRALLFAGMLLAMPVFGQSPAEDREVKGDAFGASQRRLGMLLREVDSARERLEFAEREAKDAGARLEDARKRSEAAAKALRQARQDDARARKTYEDESGAFERMRKPGAPGTAAPALERATAAQPR